MGGTGIGSYVRRHGLPPAMEAARTRPATPEEIEGMFAKPALRDGLTGGRWLSSNDINGNRKS
jgi:hypothetical protein